MKDYYPYLISLSLVLLVILALALTPGVPEATGKVHPEFKTMLHSSNSQASSAAIRYLGFAFGLGIIGIFGASLFWGSKRAKDGGFKRSDLLIGMGIYFITYCGLVFSSWQYDHVEAPIWGGLPIPTAWMLYGIWFVPVVFIYLYVRGFEKHVISPEEEEAFQKIIRDRTQRNQTE
ncbi:MAG: hypothetical protein R8P61_18115 [Bacteroidia bacterium]|nr:hypothetical protein [Bacteroidia bacterium]